MNAWPPPETITSVIAFIDDCWIEVNMDNGKGKEAWSSFHPITLSSHGCGCCANTDSPPLFWILIPE